MDSLKTKFLYQIIASLVHALIPLVTFPYIARVLGPEKIGIINFVDYTAQIFITIANFGIPLYAVREIAKVKESPALLQKLVSELLSIHIVSSIISVVAFLITMQLSYNGDVVHFLIFLACFNILFSAFSLDWFVHGLEDFKTLSLRLLTVRVLIAVLIFLLIKEAQDYQKYYALLVGGSLMLIIYDIYYLKKKDLSIAFINNSRKHVKPLFIFFLTSASVGIYTLLDTFILGIMTTAFSVGLYTTVLKIIRLSQNFIISLGGVLMPRISYLVEKQNVNEITRILQKSSLYVFTVAFPAGLLFYLLAPEIIIVLAGEQYLTAISALQILSALPLIIGLSNIFGFQILIPYKQEKKLLKVVVIGSVISIIMCIFLCPILKEDGAAFATVTAEIIVTIMLGFYANGFIELKFPFKSFLSICATSLCFIPIIYSFREFSSDDLVVLLFSLTACIIIFCFIQLYCFQNSILQEMLVHLKSTINRLKLGNT